MLQHFLSEGFIFNSTQMLRSVNADSDELFMFEMEIDFPRVFDVELRSHPDPSLTP